MTINDAMRKYRLPNPTTPEDLACGWSKTLTFGDKVLVAGHYYQHNRPCYYGAVYEFLSDDHTCEGAIGLAAAAFGLGVLIGGLLSCALIVWILGLLLIAAGIALTRI